MIKCKYITKPLGAKVAVLRVNAYYPKGMMVSKFANQTSADFWIARQNAEDAENRLNRVRAYLADRAARPAVVAAPSNQLELFAA